MDNSIRFGNEDAKRVINEMRLCYGKKFSDQWVGIDPRDLAQKMVDLFFDLTQEDLIRGFAKMQTHAFVPTLPEFKSWCVGNLKSKWLGGQEAWNTARGSIDHTGKELTVIWTKESATAFDSVIDMMIGADKYQIADAKKIYIEVYERLVLESQERGEKPCYFVSHGNDKAQHEIALKDAENAGLLESGTSALMLEYHQTPEQAERESKEFQTIAQEHLAKLQGLLKNPSKSATVFKTMQN